VLFHGLEFFINVDKMEQPELGYFLEVKSHTWSRRDAEHKAQVSIDMIRLLDPQAAAPLATDYVQLIAV
jgi:5-methylthioadenosine/S-adenosylhomocysteine deaminase